MERYAWVDDDGAVDWRELSELYRIAPLGEKPPETLATVFGNSMFKCFVYDGDRLIAAGRALADGTAMAIWWDPDRALAAGLIRRPG